MAYAVSMPQRLSSRSLARALPGAKPAASPRFIEITARCAWGKQRQGLYTEITSVGHIARVVEILERLRSQGFSARPVPGWNSSQLVVLSLRSLPADGGKPATGPKPKAAD
jgi:hypothetical protein